MLLTTQRYSADLMDNHASLSTIGSGISLFRDLLFDDEVERDEEINVLTFFM